jgi:hypothetical protein
MRRIFQPGNKEMDSDDFWQNRFHWCALAAGFLAASEGCLADSRYVRKLAYEFYETGAFKDREKASPLPSPDQAARPSTTD